RRRQVRRTGRIRIIHQESVTMILESTVMGHGDAETWRRLVLALLLGACVPPAILFAFLSLTRTSAGLAVESFGWGMVLYTVCMVPGFVLMTRGCTSGVRAAIALFYVPLMFVMLFFEEFSLVSLWYGLDL